MRGALRARVRLRVRVRDRVNPKPKPNPSPKLSPHPTPSPKPSPNLEQRAPRLGPGLDAPREDGARHRGDVAPPGQGVGVITGELAVTLAW